MTFTAVGVIISEGVAVGWFEYCINLFPSEPIVTQGFGVKARWKRFVKQILVVTNDNPIGLYVGYKIIGVHLGRSGHAGELNLSSRAVDSHDLKASERGNSLIVHDNTIRQNPCEVKLFFRAIKDSHKSLSVNDLPRAAAPTRKSLMVKEKPHFN